jgi:hypothetical protein
MCARPIMRPKSGGGGSFVGWRIQRRRCRTAGGGLQWLRGKAKLSEGELPRAIVLCWFLKCFIGIVVSGSPPNVQEVFEVCWREARVWMLCMQLSCRVPSKRAKAFPSSQSAIVIACSSRFLGSGRVRGKAMPHTILNDAMRKSATL